MSRDVFLGAGVYGSTMPNRYSALLALLIASFLITSASAGEPDPVIPRAEQAPVLDGNLNDECWTKALLIKSFTRGDSGDPVKKPVEARLCFDDQALYIGIRCAEPEPAKLKSEAKTRNEKVRADDCVEVTISTDSSELDFDQFIANALGTQEEHRTRDGQDAGAWKPKWIVKSAKTAVDWSLEIRIPASDLELGQFRRGDMVGLKISRLDYVGGAPEVSCWPRASETSFAHCYFDNRNAVANVDFSDRKTWRLPAGDESCFSSVEENGARVIGIKSPGRYCSVSQELKLRPNAAYRLSADVKASGSMGVRVRARQADQKKGDTSHGFELRVRRSDEFVPYSTRVHTGPDGQAMLIFGVTEASGTGAFQIRNLQVVREIVPDHTGKAIPLKAGEATVVSKLRVTDCRSLKGFIGSPVDGTVKSGKWNGENWEYNNHDAGAGVGYAYHDNDGLHITFADDVGFNAVVVRGGIKAKLLRECAKFDDKASGKLLYEFPGQSVNSRAFFEQPVKTDRVSFFDVEDGFIADCSFFRVTPRATDAQPALYHLSVEDKGGVFSDLTQRHLESRFGADDRKSFACVYGDPARSATKLSLQANRCVHFVSAPLEKETPAAALRFSARVQGPERKLPFKISIQDPLNPRLELFGADCDLDKPGALNFTCDFPDQVIPAGAQLWVTLRFEVPVTLETPALDLEIVSRAQAMPEALEHRKFLLRGFYGAMSEARPWTGFWKPEDVQKITNAKTEYAPWVREIVETLDQCRAIDTEGKDDIVRQYYEWLYRNILRKSKAGMPKYATRFDKIDGVPEWAVLAHQSWMQAREVPKWWIENRMVPNGELGGEVGDDTDMFGNYAPFPLFERDGVGGLVLDAGARLAATAEIATMEQGLNRRTMDPLHAYEEGVNHEAQMLWWFYGDPVYTERCMVAARSTEALTILTPKGHRHFKSQDCGAADLRMNRKTDVDGQAHPQMWHPTLELVWYNRNPKALKMLREYADGWLEHQAPGKYAHAVDVATETATETAEEPFTGGYGGQATVHTFIAALTGEAKYVQPLHDYIAAGKTGENAHRYLPELLQMGMLTAKEESFKETLSRSWPAQLYLHGDKKPMIDALKRDIEELQRFKHMYTTVECFTDRVFLYALINPTIAYTGGFVTRNKINQMHSVSWDGFGTDYAALVTAASATHLKVLICNLGNKPLNGKMTVWRLEHGAYQLTAGPDANGDDLAEAKERDEAVELARGSEIVVSLPKKGVMVLELTQTKKLDDIFARADLALSALELKIGNGEVSAAVHNLGAKDVDNVVVALVDAQGKTVKTKSLGKLSAPLDLTPKSLPFEFDGLPADVKGWTLVADPENSIQEIYEGNNRVFLRP